MLIIRWLFVIPSAILGWYIGVIIALLAYNIGEQLCPTKYIVSGSCFAPWSSFLENIYIAIGALICGSLTVLFPAIVAPKYHFKVALLSYIIGLIVSIYWLFLGAWMPVIFATLGGAIIIWLIHTRLTTHIWPPQSTPNQ